MHSSTVAEQIQYDTNASFRAKNDQFAQGTAQNGEQHVILESS